jgi:enoyl-CoA hydratase/carnithine racemase
MMCDLTVAAENAKFSYPEARLGFTGGLIAGLAGRIPHKVAMEMMLLCRSLDAQRAYNVGLVNEVVPTGQQVPVALKMAREMADFSPLVLKTLKRFVTEGVLAQGPSEQSGRAQRALHEVKESEDAEEAKLAVREKRKAAFKGR